jgi:histidine ammonia-lyase
VIEIDGRSLDLAAFRAVVHGGEGCSLSGEARARVAAARAVIDRVVASGEATYGVNTGFGDLAGVSIPAARVRELQHRLLLSHAAGVGEPLPDAAVRGMLLLRANALAAGHSGVRVEVVERLLALLAHDVLPVVPSRGSVGASGDLAPLAHLALPLIGRGRVCVRGAEKEAAEVLGTLGLEPLALEAKEGLALINGTQAMTSLLALACLDLGRLVKLADLIGGLSTDALRGTDTAFDPRLHALRPHPGQVASAANLRGLMRGSAIRESHRHGDVRIQDPYSIRCMPQVHGAVRDALTDAVRRVEIEMNAVTDNPLVFAADDGVGEDGAAEDEVLSGGNFHGAPMAQAADLLAIAATDLGSISERRIEKLTNVHFSGLPAFLVEDAGVNSGFMIAQVTAAALVAECRVLAHPASVDSVPTSADKEDHVSMGMGAALKLAEVVALVGRILAIELLAAAQGIDLLRPLRSSEPLEGLHDVVRGRVPRWAGDREMAPDLDAAHRLITGGELDPLLAELQ